MKAIAIETIFIFIISLIATIVFILFFSNIRNEIINFFRPKQPKEDFEIEIIIKNNFSENFLLELASLCVNRVKKSNLKLDKFSCYYLLSFKSFENIRKEKEVRYENIIINFTYLNRSKNNALILYSEEERKVFLIN